MNTLLGVFLLFQDEHDVVKELLQFLIGEVNTQLFKTVVLHWEYLQVIYLYIYLRELNEVQLVCASVYVVQVHLNETLNETFALPNC